MRTARAVLSLLVLPAAACRSVVVSPAVLREPADRATDRAAALTRWADAVALANDFLASPWRRTLPAGRVELTDDGMRFTSDGGCRWPLTVWSTTWGDLAVATGARAQECDGGFRVGSIDTPEGEAADPLLDNTFFSFEDGSWHDAESLARVTLHEATHVLSRTGTVGAWNTLAYYVVAVVTLSSAHHPAEDRPRATSEEFAWFALPRTTDPEYLDTLEAVRDEHMASPHDHCEHGPFPEPPCGDG